MATLVTRKPNLLTWFSTSMVVLWLLIAIGPFIWTVWGSFKVQGDFFLKS
jgi:multiple sugar transport system permease protein